MPLLHRMQLHNLQHDLIVRAASTAWLSLLCVATSYAAALPELTDSVDSPAGVNLREVTVEAQSRRPARVADDASLTIDATVTGQRMRAFGEADAMRWISTLPGISAAGDYASGVSVDGTEYSHTYYGIGGAPVFFPYHFGGIFSVFNSEHMPVVHLEKSVHTPDMPPRLGGRIDFAPRRGLTERVKGVVNVGLLASSATVSAPLGDRGDITASARVSYIDALYGSMLKANSTDIGYGFDDYNLTARLLAGAHDRLSVHLFYNRDFLKTNDDRYALDTRFRWHNFLAAGEWEHRTLRFDWHQNLYCSTFGSTFGMDMTRVGARIPSSITETGTRGHGSFRVGGPRDVRLLFGASASHLSGIPQWATVDGYGYTPSERPARVNAFSSTAHLACEFAIASSLRLTAGVRMLYYATLGYRPLFVDPTATLTWSTRAGTFNLHAAGYTQPLHQVGFSDIGLASNFWLIAGRGLEAQRARTVALSWVHAPGRGEWELSADIYYKRLTGASEYDGTTITLLEPGYSAMEHVITGDGRNYGAGMMVSRVAGRLTGSCSLAWGRAQRRFPLLGDRWVTAAVEQRLSATVQGHYRLNRAIGLDAAWTYATGRPVTPVTALYMIGENVISEFGERNSRCMPAYHRLDLSASWSFRIKRWPGIENMLILSVINAYGHSNVSIVTFGYDTDDAVFARRESASLYKFMPSLAYVMRF